MFFETSLQQELVLLTQVVLFQLLQTFLLFVITCFGCENGSYSFMLKKIVFLFIWLLCEMYLPVSQALKKKSERSGKYKVDKTATLK